MPTPAPLLETHFLKRPEVRAKIKPLRPTSPRPIPAALQVRPRTDHYMLVGTAFDWLLRIELQRRAPHAVLKGWWAAGRDPWSFWRPALLCGDLTPQAVEELEGAEVLRAFRRRSAVAAYVKNSSPTRPEQADLAALLLVPEKLDLEAADPGDVDDLLALLGVVPFDALIHPERMLLEQNFIMVRTAFVTDLISGDMLVDFKTTKKGEITAGHLDQLLFYYLLARRQHRLDPAFPAVTRAALYFCRHGHLWTVDASVWTQHPQFAAVEDWFFRRAEEVFGRAGYPFITVQTPPDQTPPEEPPY